MTHSLTSHSFTEWLTTQPAGVTGTRIAGIAGDATVVGLGTSTREAREPFRVVEEATSVLFDEGFSVLAVADNRRVGELYDRYVTGGDDVDLTEALRLAWGPWRTEEFRSALDGIRRRNHENPDWPVRILAVGPARALPDDYDQVVDLAHRLVPDAAAEIAGHLSVIRVAHDAGEHVQRALGDHDGTPYVERARAARSLASAAAQRPGGAGMLRLLDGIVEFHANALDQQYDAVAEARQLAAAILERHRRTGARIVVWEGVAHLSAPSDHITLGTQLRDALGEAYAPIAVVFGTGSIGRLAVPAPAAGSLEAAFAAASDLPRVVDLRDDVPAAVAAELTRPWRVRVVSGLYRPDADGDHYLTLPSLRRSLDGVVYLPEVTPVSYLS